MPNVYHILKKGKCLECLVILFGCSLAGTLRCLLWFCQLLIHLLYLLGHLLACIGVLVGLLNSDKALFQLVSFSMSSLLSSLLHLPLVNGLRAGVLVTCLITITIIIMSIGNWTDLPPKPALCRTPRSRLLTDTCRTWMETELGKLESAFKTHLCTFSDSLKQKLQLFPNSLL